MPTHDIIDNRKEKLVDHINRILSSTESARFAVGYFFLSGLESIAQRLAGVAEWEAEINERVARLYGLTAEEIKRKSWRRLGNELDLHRTRLAENGEAKIARRMD